MRRYKVVDVGMWYPSIWGYDEMRKCIPDTHPIKALFIESNEHLFIRRPKDHEIGTEVLNVPYLDGRIILRFSDGMHAVIHKTGVEDVTPVGRNAL